MSTRLIAKEPVWGGIPEQLTGCPRWVNWKYVLRDGEWTKTPLNSRTGSPASSTDPLTWSDFKTARSRYEAGGVDGVGFVLGDDYAGIDLDKHYDPINRILDGFATEAIKHFDSYAEISPSDCGVKIFIHGHKPGESCKRADLRVELYDWGRFFTVTGRRVEGCPSLINERQAAFEVFYNRLFESRNGNGKSTYTPWTREQIEARRNAISDSRIIEIANRREKFRKLWSGDSSDYHNDESSGDEALCFILTFYTGPDAERVEKLFNTSERAKRDKWAKREDYRRVTISKAVEFVDEYYHVEPEDSRVEVEGPCGLRAIVDTFSDTSKRHDITVYVSVNNQSPLPYYFNATPTSVDKAAIEILGRLPFADRTRDNKDKVKFMLRSAIAFAREKAKKSSSSDLSGMDVILKEAEALKLVFKGHEQMAWSEARNGFLWPRQFVELMITRGRIKKLRDVPGLKSMEEHVLIGYAKRYAESAWATILESLPEQADSQAGSDSCAAAEFSEQVGLSWSVQCVDRRGENTSTERVSLATAASSWAETTLSRIQKATGAEATRLMREATCWNQLAPGLCAWSRIGEDGRLELAMNHRLLSQLKIKVPGVRTFAAFKKTAIRYSIVEQEDTWASWGKVGAHKRRDRVLPLVRAQVENLCGVQENEE